MAGILEGVDLRTQMAGQNRLELLLFRLSSRQMFGINVFKVQEVIQCPVLTRVPGSHPVVRGIAKLRGKTVPVMDLSLAIGGPPMEDLQGRFVIITEYNKRTQGFLVNAVDRIVNMNWESILPPPKGAAGGSYLTAVTQVDKQLVEIIDVEKVLSEVVRSSDQVSAGVVEGPPREVPQHVLVVDDSVVARNQVKRVLDQLGVESTVKHNGAEALEQLRSWVDQRPQGRISDWLALVISDIEMPKLDGYSLTKRVREDPRLDDLHVILHSSLSGVFNESMVRKVGANHFLAKYDPDELARMVQEQLREHAQEHGGGGMG
jgi:two-component system, chemotaxis family, chemotaxis protein CheV